MINETTKPESSTELGGRVDPVVMRVLTEMFEADTDYGCGFYNHEPWREAYAKLQKIAGYKGSTTVFDGEFEDFSKLPDE